MGLVLKPQKRITARERVVTGIRGGNGMIWIRIILILCVLSLPLHVPETIEAPQLTAKKSSTITP